MQRADDTRGGLGLGRHRLDLLLHLLAVAQHAAQITQRFGEVATCLLLHRDDDDEEVDLGQRHPVEQDLDRLGHRLTDRLLIEDTLELRLDRLLGFLGHEAHGIVERQAGLHATHDGLDGVRQLVEEGVLKLLAARAHVHARQQIAAGDAEDAREQQRHLHDEADDEQNDAQNDLIADEVVPLDLHAGLEDLILQRHLALAPLK